MIAENFWLWEFLGRLHPLVVHFPIGLLVFAALLELFTLQTYQSKLRPGINLMVLAGSSSVLLAATLGLLLASNESTSGGLLDKHQWLGLASAGCSLLVLWSLHLVWIKNQLHRVKIYRAALFATTLGVAAAGHFGAALTHGETFLSSTLPWSNDYSPYERPVIDLAAYEAGASGLSAENELKLVGQVRAIFAHNCYKCHSEAKVEGELRLDSRAFVFQGGESGAVIVPGNAAESEVIRRVSLPKGHDDVMPSKGSLLDAKEIALISLWVEKGAPWPDAAEQQSIYRVASLAPRKPALPPKTASFQNPIDLWVNDYFAGNNLTWPQKVDDRTFLRRVYLDIVGLVPAPGEVEAYTSETNPDKQALLVGRLLNQHDDYAMHWLTFWNDALRNDYTGTGYITNGRYNITDWLYTSLKSNKPYDVFVRELLNPTEASKGFIEGIRWRGTVNASQRTEMQAAQNVGQVILGLNLKCASCHDSFISDWKLEQAYAFANIFADTTLEVSRCELPTGKLAGTGILWEELGEIDSAASRTEKLRQLSESLVQPANGRLYRTLVNRIWKQMMGRGIVEPVDEMDNEPWSQDLLDWLASDFEEKGYDIRELIYLIATSRIYQSASVAVASPDLLQADDFIFKGMVKRRLTAEQFSDAVSQVVTPVFTIADLRYNPFGDSLTALQKMPFTRASLVANNGFLTALGRPNREVVSTSRDSQASLLQALELTNGDRLNSVLRAGAEKWKGEHGSSEVIIGRLYEKAFNRAPLEKEATLARAALGNSPDAEQIQDFFWAVLLLPEFQVIN